MASLNIWGDTRIRILRNQKNLSHDRKENTTSKKLGYTYSSRKNKQETQH
ncbi:hypothetical protein [Streptococcus oralis]|nr:hypothetical protein [Streptococcus oralis]